MHSETWNGNKLMPERKTPVAKQNDRGQRHVSLPRRLYLFTRRAWRPATTLVAVALAVGLGWHVVNGKNGISVWEGKRAEDRELRKEIDGLEQENARLRTRVERLKSDPEAISHEAREKLHYAKPNEVIVALPPDADAPTR
jgi:cell division protein FtsB